MAPWQHTFTCLHQLRVGNCSSKHFLSQIEEKKIVRDICLFSELLELYECDLSKNK